MVGRADRDNDHRRAGVRTPVAHALVPGHRLSQLPVNLGVDRPHAVPLPLHGVGLFRLPGAGDFARRMFQGARRAVGASRAIVHDDAGVFSRPAPDVGVADFLDGSRRVLLPPVEDSVCGPIRRQRVHTHRADSVRLLLPDLGRNPDQPRRILRAHVAPIRRNPQLDIIPLRRCSRVLARLFPSPRGKRLLHPFWFPFPRGKGLGVRFLYAILLCAMLAAVSTPARAAAADQKNLLLNGDFKKGSEDQPDSWRIEAWINSPDAFQTHWHSYTDKPSEMEADNLNANDGCWM